MYMFLAQCMHEVADISSVSEYFISETTELISIGFIICGVNVILNCVFFSYKKLKLNLTDFAEQDWKICGCINFISNTLL